MFYYQKIYLLTVNFGTSLIHLNDAPLLFWLCYKESHLLCVAPVMVFMIFERLHYKNPNKRQMSVMKLFKFDFIL